MNSNLNGFNVKEITLYADGNIQPGMAVSVKENHTAAIPSANERFAGICTAVRGGYVSVALTGILTVPYSGTGISVGYNPVTADGNGYIKFNVSSSEEFLVFDIDETEHLMTILL